MATCTEQRGFTLVELMMTVLIASILMAIAVPSFRTLGQNSQQRNVVSDVYGMLTRMRSEAATRHVGITACASSDQTSCSGSAEWEHGWIIFVDGTAPSYSSDGDLDPGEVVVQVHAALPNGVTLRPIGITSVLRLDKDGLPTVAGATFRYCDERGLTSLRALIVGPSGVARTSQDGKAHDNSVIGSCT